MDFSIEAGWFTLDNASNNTTMMQCIELEMTEERDLEFDAEDRQIMCFGHIVELSSGRVVGAASGNVDDRDDESSSDSDDTSNPIAKARAAVRAIRGSGLRRCAFDDVVRDGNANRWFKQGQPPKIVQLKQLQLLRDVRTRWDSVYQMLKRLREMRPVSCTFGSILFLLSNIFDRPLITFLLSPTIVNWQGTGFRLMTGPRCRILRLF
jgi:hypothetical protein